MKSMRLGGGLTAACLLLLSGVLGPGCSSDDDSNYCGSYLSKLKGCGLLAQDARLSCTEPDNATERCQAECLLDNSCVELESLYCESESTSISTCVAACRTEHALSCGDGTTYPENYRCDGDDDCANGSDEDNCPTFTCGSGEQIPRDYRCDYGEDCEDGSDEDNCPSFTCGSGEQIPLNYECDGEEDCSDGSDERNCPDSLEDVLICS